MKTTILTVAFLTGLSTSAMASDNKWQNEAMDAWIDGKAEATLLFNGNLDSFDINTDVAMGNVTLTGKVDTTIDKELAEELVLGIDGVKSVDNALTVVNKDVMTNTKAASQFTDAKINTVITSRLIFDSQVSGTAIDVDVDNRKVTLNGTVASDSERDLAMAIARNADDVDTVIDKLIVESDSE